MAKKVRKKTPRRRKTEVVRITCQLCNKPTTEKKDYCIEHIDQSPYAKKLLKLMADADDERAAVAKKGGRAIKKNSPILASILHEIKDHGKMTTRKLAQLVELPKKVLDVYLRRLAHQKKIVLGHNARKDETVELAR